MAVRRGLLATLVSGAIVTAAIGSLGALVIPDISRAYHVPGFEPHMVHSLQCKTIASARLKNDEPCGRTA